MVSPYIDSVNPDYVDWYVYARKALPFEDLLENTYTCLNYLAMFAELVVFLEIFLKKENYQKALEILSGAGYEVEG